jgi:predicted TIM-barrel fold metal-dependent hydrolase
MTVDPYEEERQRSLEAYERRERKAKVIRVSDSERERAVRQLRQHLADGRLDMDEFAERMELVYEAKTNVDLDEALHQLPFVSVDVAILTSPNPLERRDVGLPAPVSGARSFPYHVAAFALASGAVFLVTGVLFAIFGGSLPAVVLLPMAIWAAVLLSRAINEIRRGG